MRQFDKFVEHLETCRRSPKDRIVADFVKYFDEMSSQARSQMGVTEGHESITTTMPWLGSLRPLPRKIDYRRYAKFHEDDLPDAYITLLAAAARLVGSGPDLIHFLVKTYFEHDNTDATIDRIIYRIQD